MARRRHSYRKKSGVYGTPAGFGLGGGGTRESVMAAAEVFAEQARVNAAAFSTRIPAATGVEALNEQTAAVVTDGGAAPNAAPFEFAERHPLFGNRGHWYRQPRRAYMDRAARNSSTNEQALQVYGDLETALLAAEFGYNG